METVRNFIFFVCSIITSGCDCRHEIKRRLLLGRKANLDSILNSRDITLPTMVHLVKAVVFPVVMYGYESWTMKKVEHRRIDAFEPCYWRRLLRVPWTTRRSNQSIKENQSWLFTERTDAEAETPILWSTDAKKVLIVKDPDAGKNWSQEIKGTREDETIGWNHWLDGHEFEQALGVGDVQGSLVCCSPGVTKSQTQLSDWTGMEEREEKKEWKK